MTKCIIMLLAFLSLTVSAAELQVVEGPDLCSLKWNGKVIVERSEMNNIGFKAIGGSDGVAEFKDFGVTAGKVYYYRLRTNDGTTSEQSCVPTKTKE